MPSALRIVREGSRKEPIGVEEFLGLLDYRSLDTVTARVQQMRETFQAKVPRDRGEYRAELVRFWNHHCLAFYGAAPKPDPSRAPNAYDDLALNDLERWYGNSLHDVERDAILNRNGGLIAILDKITEALVKQHIQAYIEGVFFDYMPTDPHLRLRLAEELLRYFPQLRGDDMQPAFFFSANIEQVLTKFAMDWNRARMLLRY
jgi:hypothetical protein